MPDSWRSFRLSDIESDRLGRRLEGGRIEIVELLAHRPRDGAPAAATERRDLPGRRENGGGPDAFPRRSGLRLLGRSRRRLRRRSRAHVDERDDELELGIGRDGAAGCPRRRKPAPSGIQKR